MPITRPKVVVVGAGILGASIAWRLATRGADVTVVDRHPCPAGGVTGLSYGWIGTGSHWPDEDRARFTLTAPARADYRRLEEELGALPIAARGALVWSEGEAETTAFVEAQRAAGVTVDALPRRETAAREPHLAEPPPLAAGLPDDLAIEPGALAALFLRAASEAGCRLCYDTVVERVAERGGRVAGVATDRGDLTADVVVLANGTDAVPLAAAFDTGLALCERPAVLLRFASTGAGPRHLLYAAGLELRPTLAGGITVSEDLPPGGDAGLAKLAARTGERLASLLGLAAPPVSLAAASAMRPMTVDGVPLCCFLGGIGGLYAVVAHPGVMLAPSLSRRAADDIAAW